MVCLGAEMCKGKKAHRYFQHKVFAPLPKPPLSSGASGGSLHGGVSFKVGKAHFAAWKTCIEKDFDIALAPHSSPLALLPFGKLVQPQARNSENV